MISHLASSGSSVLVIVAALGAVVGLYLFFRGFWLLQHKPNALRESAPKTLPAITTITTFTSEGSDALAQTTSREIIRLSPESTESSLSPNTQQGKIAAALLRAGISNPASWSTTGDHSESTVRVADPPRNNGNSASALPALDLNTFKTLKQAGGQSALRIPAAASNPAGPSFGWKPALMIWGGPALTLACVYILAAHFGWL